MTTDTTSSTDGDQASTSGSPQAGGTSTTDGQAPVSQPTDHEKIIEQLRKENAATRKRLAEFEKVQQDAEQAKLTEQERLQKHAADLQSKYDSDTAALTERIVRYEVERQASKLGIVDPDAAAKLIDWSALDYDEDGTPTNAETLLKDLLKARPWLASTQQGKPPASSGGATNPSRTAAASTGLSWDAISKMTSEQYNARRSEIMTWMQSNPPKRF